jgi:hypothetical protein
VQVDEVAEDVAFQRDEEGMTAALQSFKQIGSTEAFETTSGVGGLWGKGFW